ncbi:peroxiredoxin [Dyella sp. ASV21]|uniref:peroxiredoxin n=1 Tax=Dyella sp. ASV21 TaxID=2795114 RepID=UPI0018EC50BD|nr:peroxiredoxin [Dyella sp. ASV21]
MRRFSLWLMLTLLLGLIAPVYADEPAALPQVGQVAPDFRLQDQNGKWHTPADHKGHWVVLYFYPKDFTPGCTKEVCTFRDDISKLRQAGADVLGVSLDDVKSHAEFAEKYHVPFPLLSDADSKTAQAYGVLTSKVGFKYARRTTFLIDPQGKVAKVYQDVDPEKNSAQVLADLQSLKASG